MTQSMSCGDDELEHFKTAINLSELMAAFDYTLDRRASSRDSATMVHTDGDKLIVSRGADGHWVYFSVRDDADHGTAIDFVQRRTRENLGHVRRRLRDWLRSPTAPARPAPDSFAARLEPVERDLARVRARYAASLPLGPYNTFLAEMRRLPMALLQTSRFEHAVRLDERGNALFPHYNRDGLCGYEIKNSGFTGFAPGGTKGLWGSRKEEDDERLVIAETAIDALSYAALRGHERTRFVSVAGELNTIQPGLLSLAIEKIPPEGAVVLALDNDDGGDRLAAKVTETFSAAGRNDLALVQDRPATRGTDWNDALRDSTPPPPDAVPG